MIVLNLTNTENTDIVETKDDFRLLLDTDSFEVAKIKIRKKFPTAHNFINKTIR